MIDGGGREIRNDVRVGRGMGWMHGKVLKVELEAVMMCGKVMRTCEGARVQAE